MLVQRRVTFQTFVHRNRPYGIERRGRRKNLDKAAPKKILFPVARVEEGWQGRQVSSEVFLDLHILAMANYSAPIRR